MLGFHGRTKNAWKKAYLNFKEEEHRLARSARACKGVSSCDSGKMRIIIQGHDVIYSNMRK